mgnify:CR=1 FL=1
MANKIKCEWCGNVYDTEKFENCPKCGGTNSSVNISEPHKILNTTIKRQDRKPLSKGVKTLLILAGLFIGLPLVLFIIMVIVETFIILGGSKGDNLYVYDEEGNISEENYLEDSYSGNKSLFGSYDDNYIYHTYYVESDEVIETSTGGRFRVPYFAIDIYSSGNYVSSSFSPYVYIQVLDKDYYNHEIEMYVERNGTKIRLNDTNSYSFSNSNITSLNDILKNQGELTFYATCSSKAEDLENIDTLIIDVDGEEYRFSLKYLREKTDDYRQLSKDYIISEKIKFGDNTMFIDTIRMESNNFKKSNLDLIITTDIKDNSYKDVRFFLEDAIGIKYEVFFDSYNYDKNLSCFNDLLKASYHTDSRRIYGVAYGREIVPKKLIVIIDDETYSFDI